MKLEPVCTNPEEAALLHAALNDFSREGARAAYAEWLANAGDADRAETVRQTIAAYHSFDAAPLSDAAGSAAWQMMLGVPFLSEFAGSELDRSVLESMRDQVFARMLPAVMLAYEEAAGEAPAVGSSFLWGQPDLPDGASWPLVAEASNWFGAKEKLPAEQPCLFVGQFNYADFGGTVFGQSLPAQGGFGLFSITETDKLGVVEIVLRSWTEPAALSRREPPPALLEDKLGDSANLPKPVHRLIARETVSLPDLDGPVGQAMTADWSSDQRIFYEKLWYVCDEIREAFYEGLDSEMDECVSLGLGGYLSATSGEDPSPNAESIRFAVLRTDPEYGVVHFAIPKTDVPTGNLERVEYVWNDWDS